MSTTTPATLPTTGTWNIDSVHSSANFSLKHNIVATFRARFLGVTGKLEDGALSGSVPVESLELAIPVFKEHVVGEGFLDSANHPNLTFRSSDVHAHDDGTVHVDGEITIRGVTKPISASGRVSGPVEVTRPDGTEIEVVGLDLTATVDRRDFGLEIYAGAGWEVTIEVDLQLVKA